MTIYDSLAHNTKLAADWMDSQNAKVGEKWHVDETVVNVNGEQRSSWEVMDSETRMLLAAHIRRTRSMPETRVPLRKAKDMTETLPKLVFTDGMLAVQQSERSSTNTLGRETL